MMKAVIATGKTVSIREVVKIAFGCVGIELEFDGEGLNEKAFIKSCNHPNYQLQTGKEVINIDPNYFRASEVDYLKGDATKAKEKLGWKAEIKVEELIKEMVISDLKEIKNK